MCSKSYVFCGVPLACFILQSLFLRCSVSCLQRILAVQSLCYPDLQKLSLILVYLCDFQGGKCCSYLQAYRVFTGAAGQPGVSSHFWWWAARRLVTRDGFQCAYICVHFNNRWGKPFPLHKRLSHGLFVGPSVFPQELFNSSATCPDLVTLVVVHKW